MPLNSCLYQNILFPYVCYRRKEKRYKGGTS